MYRVFSDWNELHAGWWVGMAGGKWCARERTRLKEKLLHCGLQSSWELMEGRASSPAFVQGSGKSQLASSKLPHQACWQAPSRGLRFAGFAMRKAQPVQGGAHH